MNKLYILSTSSLIFLGVTFSMAVQAQAVKTPTTQETITAPRPAPASTKTAQPVAKKAISPGQEIAKKEQLKLSPEERKVIQELFDTTLKPLALERIDYDMELLKTHKICVEKSLSAEAFRNCDYDFLQAKREKMEELVQKIETKRAELDKKYNRVKTQNSTEHPFFKMNGQ